MRKTKTIKICRLCMDDVEIDPYDFIIGDKIEIVEPHDCEF